MWFIVFTIQKSQLIDGYRDWLRMSGCVGKGAISKYGDGDSNQLFCLHGNGNPNEPAATN